MNLRRLNESFKQMCEDFSNNQRCEIEEIRSILFNAISQIDLDQQDDISRALSDCLERIFPDKSWWEITSCNIRNTLFKTGSVQFTIDEIVNNLKLDECIDISSTNELDDLIDVEDQKIDDIDLHADVNESNCVKRDMALVENYDFGDPKDISRGVMCPSISDFVSFVERALDDFREYAKEHQEDDFAKRLTEKHLVNLAERIDSSFDYCEAFDEYWKEHYKAIKQDLKAAQDMIPVEFRK